MVINTRGSSLPLGWKNPKLQDICTINYGRSAAGILASDGMYPVVGTSGSYRLGSSYFVEGETVIIGRKGSIGEPSYFNEKIWVIDTAFYTSNLKETICKWLFYYLCYAKLEQYNESTGVPSLSRSTLYNLSINLPPLPEQQKIVKVLSSWDQAIGHVRVLIEKKQLQKRALDKEFFDSKNQMQGPDKGYHERVLGEFLRPNTRKIEKPDGSYLRLGIRSHGKGTFLTTVDNPEDVLMTHLYRAQKGDLIVNITFAWEGAIAIVGQEGDGALVSHRFPTYVFDTSKVLPDFFKHMMTTERFFYELGLISPGGAGRNRVMNKTDFLKIKVEIPSLEEQAKIAGILCTLDREIDLLKKYLEKLQQQKQGLMQKLLTGEIRVTTE